MKRIYLATIAAAGALTLAACGSSGSSSKTSSNTPPPGGGTTAASSPASTDLPTEPGSVTVGSAAFQENELLADIYADAMAAQGVDVKKHVNIGERSLYLQALGDGSIGMVPEYSGSILYNLDTGASAKSSDDVFAALQDAAASNGYAVTQYSEAQDSDTISVTKQTADKYHLTSIGDLADVAGDLTLGAPAQFRTRADGVPALKSVYGVEFGNFTPTEAGGTVTINALKNGSIDAADIFSTDPAIPDNHLVPLEDPKNMFAAQN
ncbi:MAG: osmoprotectant transport system substrate-binding protein, partial [Pseudonocardiales bacterium]|nr:osmoprotectant transport system substrate-binding protein [Pseudonocardiales bacterium]